MRSNGYVGHSSLVEKRSVVRNVIPNETGDEEVALRVRQRMTLITSRRKQWQYTHVIISRLHVEHQRYAFLLTRGFQIFREQLPV